METIAYLILAHNDPKHLSRLIKALDFKCDFYVHIDKKMDSESFHDAICLPNIYFINDRYSVSWGGISMVNAQLALITAANENGRYSHLLFLSGADYPIQSKWTIHRTITADPNRQFVKYMDMRDSPEHYLKQVKKNGSMSQFCLEGGCRIRSYEKF